MEPKKQQQQIRKEQDKGSKAELKGKQKQESQEYGVGKLGVPPVDITPPPEKENHASRAPPLL